MAKNEDTPIRVRTTRALQLDGARYPRGMVLETTDKLARYLIARGDLEITDEKPTTKAGQKKLERETAPQTAHPGMVPANRRSRKVGETKPAPSPDDDEDDTDDDDGED